MAPRTERPTTTSGREALVDRLIGWRRTRLASLSVTGALFAVLGYIGANTPSLLPRPWYLQGLIAAVCAVFGYLIGTTLSELGHLVRRWSGLQVSIRPNARLTLLRIWLVVLVVIVIAFPFQSSEWQQLTTAQVGMPPPGIGHVPASTLVAVVVFLLFIGGWRLIAGLFDWLLLRVESRVLKESIARVIATAATGGVIIALLNQIIVPGGLNIAERQADRVNARNPQGRSVPSSPLRSGGPGSSESWGSLGQDGAIFVSGGPNAAQISQATGQPAKEPIRIFVGVGRPTLEARRDAAIAELDRTDAWGRRALYVITATSTGFINERSVEALELLLDGDCASVSMQYSTLPSAFGLLTAGDDPPRASRMLLDAVRARLAAIPPERRPKLYVGGESLGAYGGNGAFETPQQQLAQVDGAVWSGTPSFSPLHKAISARRNPGSTAVNPVVDNGQHFRFAGRPDELFADQYGRPLGAWEFPRVVYLQHPSDPVVWWSPSLAFETPDWLKENRTGTPMAQMSWYPLVTFWQVTADMAMSNEVPGGFGHRYVETELVPTWAAVLGLDPTVDRRPLIELIARLNS